MSSTFRRTRLFAVVLLTLSAVLTIGAGSVPTTAKAATIDPLYFKETGYWLEPDFRTYFEQHGGVQQFGFPITDELREINPADGKAYNVQYFERARMEFHPELPQQYRVELGLLGLQVAQGRTFVAATDTSSSATRYYFPETKHSLSGKFKQYWDTHGGLAIYGYPISEEFQEVNPSDGKTYTVQYFERNRFELHPENQPPYDVELGLLGVQILSSEGWKNLGTEWSFHPPADTQNTGKLGQNSAVLPNGRVVTPAGNLTTVDEFPLGLNLTPDGNQLLVSNDGYGPESIMSLNPSDLSKNNKTSEKLLFGKGAIDTKRNVVYYASPGQISGKWNDSVIIHSLNGGKDSSIPLASGDYPTGVAISPDMNTLYVVNNMTDTMVSIDLTAATPTITARTQVGNFPYAVTVSADGSKIYVTNWGIYNYSKVTPPTTQPSSQTPPSNQTPQAGSSVWTFDAKSLNVTNKISIGIQPGQDSLQLANPVAQGGSHPTAMLFNKDGSALYVADANNDAVSVVSTANGQEIRRISLLPFKGSQFGSYPSALALSPDGNTLYVAMSGLNAVDVVDVSPNANPQMPIKGMIPTAWYPSSLALSADGNSLYVASAKGWGSGPINYHTTYILDQLIGTVQKVDLTKEDLNKDSNLVMADDGYVRSDLPSASQNNPIPAHPGLSSPIKHVVFITRENRSYDQDLGDLGKGNGDPTLVDFGKNVTPNLHQLANQYAFSDNFYADGETSNPGHQWLTAGNVTDFTEKTMPYIYSGRRPGFKNEDPEDYTVVGYLFNNLTQHNVSWFDYGDLIRVDGYSPNYTGQNPLDYTSPTPGLAATWNLNVPIPSVLQNHYDPNYPGWNLKITDTRRANEFLKQFNTPGYQFPQFTYVWLPDDHTAGDGAAPGFPTRATSVADNDQATGMIIDAISHSQYWDSTAIFIAEDDSQDGSDHVDAHRTVDMVISPYVKQGYISHEHYSQASMLKTMELILGLPPMSQYDSAALPMWDLFQSTPNLSNSYTMIPQKVTPQIQPAPTSTQSLTNLDLSKPDTLDADGDGDGD